MSSGQTLYCAAACNSGVSSALAKFITAETLAPAPALPRFTAAIFRYGLKDPASCFGRGGVLSTSVSNFGLATVVGWLPNGAKLTYSGYAGRACLPESTAMPDPLLPFVSTAQKEEGGTDSFGIPNDLTGTAIEIMQESLARQTASVSIPIWSTSPAGESAAEPLFGALLLSGLTVEGCLGVLNPVPVVQGGLEAANSEYTHNYVRGYLYDPTLAPGWPKPDPYTPTAKVTLSTIAPSADAATYPLENTAFPSTLGTQTSMGTLGGTGTGFVFTPSLSAKTLVSSPSFLLDSTTGLLTGSYVEQTTRYVSINLTTPSKSIGPSWAYTNPVADEPKIKSTSFKASLSVKIYAATIQGGEGSIFFPAGGAAGFLMRGTGGLDTLKNVLGNGGQDPFTGGSKPTYRTEGVNINVYEAN
jgi:hypothetical protein